jgi:hypothetical protein
MVGQQQDNGQFGLESDEFNLGTRLKEAEKM